MKSNVITGMSGIEYFGLPQADRLPRSIQLGIKLALSTLTALFVLRVGQAHAQIIGPGPIAPFSRLCGAYQALYPNTQITDNGDAIPGHIQAAFPNYFYAGYGSDSPGYTMALYDLHHWTDPLPDGEACYDARVNWLQDERDTPTYTTGFTCYSSAACRDKVVPQRKIPEISDGVVE